MSVHLLKDGRWIVQHEKGKDPERPNATRRYFGRGLSAEADANAFDQALHYKPDALRTPRFVELANEYLEDRKMSMSRVGWDLAVEKLRRTILPLIGHEMAHHLNPQAITQYASTRAADGVKRTTIHREISDIRAILNWARKRKIILDNPMAGYEMPKRDDARLSPPTDAEFQAMLKAAAPHLQRAMLIAYFTGLRPGREEMLCLRWDAVDFIGRTLMVVSAQKGGMPSRMVPLTDDLYGHLCRWYEADEKTGICYIIHHNGKKIDSLKTAWKAAKKRARVLRRIRLYDIRHAFATNLLASGANLKAVSEILGHASPDMTMKIYQHVSGDLRRAAVDMLSGKNFLLENDPQTQ